MSVFSQLGQGSSRETFAGLPLADAERDAFRARYSRLGNWEILCAMAATGSINDRLNACRCVFGAKQRGEPMQATHRRIYALGCWLALESLHDRLVHGDAILCQMRGQGETGKRFDRLSMTWLKLGFRAIALIGRMGWADPEIERQFCQSPTGHYFADAEWPDTPPACDVDTLLVQSRLVA